MLKINHNTYIEFLSLINANTKEELVLNKSKKTKCHYSEEFEYGEYILHLRIDWEDVRNGHPTLDADIWKKPKSHDTRLENDKWHHNEITIDSYGNKSYHFNFEGLKLELKVKMRVMTDILADFDVITTSNGNTTTRRFKAQEYTFESFKNKIQENGIKILNENIVDDFPEIVVDQLPGKLIPQQGCMRNKLYDFDPYFIKNHDGGKFGTYLSPIDELRKEVKAWKDFSEIVPITEKISILYLDKTNEVFLVEKKIEPFDEVKWKSMEIYEAALILLNETKKKFPNVGDFELKNLGYDKTDWELKFFDVFPQKNANTSEHK